MALYKDQLGRIIELHHLPQRIISLVPSQTELLYDLGLEDEVTGITKFCIHPQKWFRSKTRIGGTKQLHLNQIRELTPDLIIANKEENTREQIEELAKEFPVWTSDVNNYSQALEMIMAIGKMTGKEMEAQKLFDEIRKEFSKLSAVKKYRAAYFIWKDPYMVAGHDNFIHDMMQHAGFENVFSDRTRYPSISIDELKSLNCEVLLLSSEPYPFSQKHIDELQPLLPGIKILLVDGEMFSWYGSRMAKAPAYFMQLQNQVLSLSHAGN